MSQLEDLDVHLQMLSNDEEKHKLIEAEELRLEKLAASRTIKPLRGSTEDVNFIDNLQDIRIRSESF